VGDHLYLNCEDTSNPEKEAVVCLDLNGKKIWETQTGNVWARSYRAARSTPTYAKDVKLAKAASKPIDIIVVLTGSGEVCSLNAKDGNLLWKQDIASMYAGNPGNWGYAESLVVKDDKVFVTPCGSKASVVALQLADGKVAWEADSNGDKCGYVSPILNGDQLIQLTAKYIFCVDTKDGKTLWKHSYADDSSGKWKGINCNSPILKNNQIFVTAGYNQGGVMYQILPDNQGVKKRWTTDDLDPHHHGVVELDGRLYGSNWINNGNGNWLCVDWETGKTIYETKWANLGKGPIITADGMLYLYEEKRGTLGLVKPGDQFNLVSHFQIDFGSKEHWSHPIISDGILYVRHGDALAAYDLRNKTSQTARKE
jgi:outer membrane protein assembly factor BamB